MDTEKEIALLRALTGRTCGDCSMCCKVLTIEGEGAIDKPAGKWCVHCRPGRGGCSIYANRPELCSGFTCQWVIDRGMGDEWRPTRSKIVVYLSKREGVAAMVYAVDTASPNAWRAEPYYSAIKRSVLSGIRGEFGFQFVVKVTVGDRVLIILPDEEVEVTRKSFSLAVVGDKCVAEVFDNEDHMGAVIGDRGDIANIERMMLQAA